LAEADLAAVGSVAAGCLGPADWARADYLAAQKVDDHSAQAARTDDSCRVADDSPADSVADGCPVDLAPADCLVDSVPGDCLAAGCLAAPVPQVNSLPDAHSQREDFLQADFQAARSADCRDDFLQPARAAASPEEP
jgi:hypothetical protein